jgi:hypothetical protein
LAQAIVEEERTFFTTDGGTPHQQNLVRPTLAIIPLEATSNSYEDLAPLMERVNAVLSQVRPGEVIRVLVEQV